MKEKQKILVGSKISIVADYRERELIERLRDLGAMVNIQPLLVGDFVCSERIVVERKTHDDFINSIIDSRIFEQSRNMKENFEKIVLIVEGYSNRNMNENALNAATASLITDFGVSIISSRNPLETARLIYWIAKKEQGENKIGIAVKVGKKPKDVREMQEFVISGIPGISDVLSKRLLKHFGSVEKVFTADVGQLEEVKGLSRKKAENIRKLLTKKY